MNYEDRVTKEYVEGLLAGAGVKFTTGTFTGDDTEGSRYHALPFEPRLLILAGYSNTSASPIACLSFTFGNYTHILQGTSGNYETDRVWIDGNGFWTNYYCFNAANRTQHYFALR